jgi:hypothetical protein
VVAPPRRVLVATEAVKIEVLKRRPGRVLRRGGDPAEDLGKELLVDLELMALGWVAAGAFADLYARARVDVLVGGLIRAGNEACLVP